MSLLWESQWETCQQSKDRIMQKERSHCYYYQTHDFCCNMRRAHCLTVTNKWNSCLLKKRGYRYGWINELNVIKTKLTGLFVCCYKLHSNAWIVWSFDVISKTAYLIFLSVSTNVFYIQFKKKRNETNKPWRYSKYFFPFFTPRNI